MNEMTLTEARPSIKEYAREQAKQVLAQSQSFSTLPVEDQKNLYRSLVDEYMTKEMDKRGVSNGVSKSLATDSGKEMGYKGYDPSFGGDTRSFKELVDSVDFPKFVADLLKAVFDANLHVMKVQTDSYIKLMKEATKSSADFIKKVKDDDTFGKLIEKHPDKYNITKKPDGSMELTNAENEKADMEDAEVKKHIIDAKIEMAKEHRAALREVLLMGVTRLVVEKGEIDAAVEFTMHATRESKAHHDDQNVNVTSVDMEYGGGLMGSIFGGPSGSMNMTNTNIQVNSSDKKATDDLSATLKGHVNIKFKTDYFKLDNFANMYADGGVAALKPQQGQGQLPAGGAPAGAK